MTRVTINNNRQNPVEPWNLHANDDIQLELQSLSSLIEQLEGCEIDAEGGGGSDTTILVHLSADRERAYAVSM